MPEIASIREDFPALCQPMAAIAGISRSTSSLKDSCDHVIKNQDMDTHPRANIRVRNSNIALRRAAYRVSDIPTGGRGEGCFFFFFWKERMEELVGCVAMLIECKY